MGNLGLTVPDQLQKAGMLGQEQHNPEISGNLPRETGNMRRG